MSRSCQSATFSSPVDGCAADDARQPADPLRDDRVPLVRHRRRALLAAAERLLDLAHLGPREVADLEREPLQRRRQQRERVQHLGVAVALEDLRRARRRLEPEPLAGDPLDLGIGGGVGADRAGQLADADPLERARDPDAVALERERPAGELEAERRRLGVDAVRPADRDRLAGAPRPARSQRRARARARRGSARPPRGAAATSAVSSDVGRGQPVVEPAALVAELLGDGVDERGDVVLGSRFDLGDALGRRDRRARADRVDRGARDGCRCSAQPSSAASSTSSQRANLASSDQIAAMAGRE